MQYDAVSTCRFVNRKITPRADAAWQIRRSPIFSFLHPTLGAWGRRFCKKLFHKVTSDRYGQRGTTAHLLMRVATSLDILQDRPSSWPKPPSGFSNKRVLLAPGSDFPKQNKRTRGGERSDPSAPGSDPPLMNSSLSAGRAGFSVEEMEAERARKRAKESTDKPQRTDESA
jgi:hypothetical protein